MAEDIKALFLDIGGVLLTSGWDRNARRRAVSKFNLDQEETEERHHLTFDIYEAGLITIDEYLNRIVFYRERNFSKEDFKTFMYSQSSEIEGSIEFFKSLKSKHHLKVFAVNNEALELNDFRIKKYNLEQLFDAFISSCYMHLRKPDFRIFNMACDIANLSPSNILYIDDRLLFVEVALSLGINGYHFQGLDSAKLYMQTFGL